MEHELKCWPDSFVPIEEGLKPFEIRANDRGFKVGDHLRLREWEPGEDYSGDNRDDGEYTGREMVVEVIWMCDEHDFGGVGLREGVCVMSIELVDSVMFEGDVPLGYEQSP